MENKIKGQKNYKDTLFKLIFGNEDHKEFTLSLYNAINKSNYTDPNDIKINTLDDVLYIKMKNDVSFILDSTMCLYEQQSTYNPNMAYRMLEYTMALFQNYVVEKNYNKYRNKQFKLPSPNFVVFYNGLDEKVPDKYIQKLSDMYECKDRVQLDLEVTVYNINEGSNNDLKHCCKPLYEYMWFIGNVRCYMKNKEYSEELVGEAVTKAIENMPDSFGIKKIISKEKKEVVSMLFEDFNEELYKKAAIDDAEESYNNGYAKGSEENITSTIKRMYTADIPLNTICVATGLSEDEVKKRISELQS